MLLIISLNFSSVSLLFFINFIIEELFPKKFSLLITKTIFIESIISFNVFILMYVNDSSFIIFFK